MRNKQMQYYKEFEKLSAEIFELKSFETKLSEKNSPFDVIATKNQKKYYIEVKASSTVIYRNSFFFKGIIRRLKERAEKDKATPILMVYSVINKEDKMYYEKKEGVSILDLKDILFITNGHNLYEKVVRLLPFSPNKIDITPLTGDMSSIFEESSIKKDQGNCDETIDDDILTLLKEIKSDNISYDIYEQKCTRILKNLFSKDLIFLGSQKSSNNKLYYFDQVCRIKTEVNNCFWLTMERSFNSKYIVFEYKDYKSPITQKEIYTTEKYLYNKALRNVAIIIAKNGHDKNSSWAAKGCLRENGKLIMILDINDLVKMYEMNKNGTKAPTDHLMEMLDNLLITLEK